MINIFSNWHKLSKDTKKFLCWLTFFFQWLYVTSPCYCWQKYHNLQILKWTNILSSIPRPILLKETSFLHRQRKIIMIDILPLLRLRFSTSILLHCSLRSLVACRKAILFSSSFVHKSFHWTQKNHNEIKMQSINHKKQKRKKEERKKALPLYSRN